MSELLRFNSASEITELLADMRLTYREQEAANRAANG